MSPGSAARAYSPAVVVIRSKTAQQAIEARMPRRATAGVSAAAHLW
ncbi:MAG: hypothetical protein M0D55_17115 [Elusimicrobiota bacterium]|nr:MAG: hypothetical protein M0D55_17115 [Elusimicrobiota bacterium]